MRISANILNIIIIIGILTLIIYACMRVSNPAPTPSTISLTGDTITLAFHSGETKNFSYKGYTGRLLASGVKETSTYYSTIEWQGENTMWSVIPADSRTYHFWVSTKTNLYYINDKSYTGYYSDLQIPGIKIDFKVGYGSGIDIRVVSATMDRIIVDMRGPSI